MILKVLSGIALAATFLASARPLVSQAVDEAEQTKVGFSLGAGFSDFDPDVTQNPLPDDVLHEGWGQGRMWGATVWADAGIPASAKWVRGFSIEAEYRTIFAGGSAGQSQIRESHLAGGAAYTWRHWDRVNPYVKYLFGYGAVSFPPEPETNGTTYSQDSRGINIVGAGAEVRCTGHLWVRAEYEYESWGELLGPHLQPQGFTVGAMYHFRRSAQR